MLYAIMAAKFVVYSASWRSHEVNIIGNIGGKRETQEKKEKKEKEQF